MSRLNRIKPLVFAMNDEERVELFDMLEENFCQRCGQELPDEDSKEPDHACPFEDLGDEEDEDDEDGEDDEESEDDDE